MKGHCWMAIEIDIWDDDNTWNPIEKTRTRCVSRVSSDYEWLLSTGFSWSHSKPIIGLCHWQFLCQNPGLKAPIVRKRRLGLLLRWSDSIVDIEDTLRNNITSFDNCLSSCAFARDWNGTRLSRRLPTGERSGLLVSQTLAWIETSLGAIEASATCGRLCFPEAFWVSTGCFHDEYTCHVCILFIYNYIWYTGRRNRYVVVYLYTHSHLHIYPCMFVGCPRIVVRRGALWPLVVYIEISSDFKWQAFKIGSCQGMDGSESRYIWLCWQLLSTSTVLEITWSKMWQIGMSTEFFRPYIPARCPSTRNHP